MKILTTTLILILGFLPFSLVAQDFWEQLHFPDSVEISCIATNSQGYVFVGTATQFVNDGVFRSIDGGQSWEIVKELQYGSVLAIDINENNEIYVGLNGPPWLYQSNDNGETWQPIFIEDTYSYNIISINAFSVDTIYFSCWNGPSVYRSFNHGESWNSSLTIDTGFNVVWDIAITSNRVVYVCCNTYFEGNGGVYKSTDYGETWDFLGLLNHQVLCIEANSNNDIFAGDWFGDINESIGLHALYHNQTEFTHLYWAGEMESIAINSEDHIYFTGNSSVFYSIDNGENFTFIDDPLSDNKSILEFDKQGYLYAANKYSLARSVKSTITAVNEKQITNKPNISPNPCQNELKISFNNNPVGNEKIIVNIYSITGELMRNLAITTNSSQCNIATDQLEYGVYFLHIVSSNNNDIIKFVKN